MLVSILCTADEPPSRTYGIAVWGGDEWCDECGDAENGPEFTDYRVTHWMSLPQHPEG